MIPSVIPSVKVNISTLRPRTCGRLVVSQPLGAPNQYRAPNLRISWPWNNTRLISLRNTSNSWWIMNNSTKWLWTWLHRVVIHVRPLSGRITTSLILLLLQLRHCANLIYFFETHSICNEYYLTLFFCFWCLIKFYLHNWFFYY
jgi:hypothetical protein